ncbi:hypothetical protein J4410_01400 [Candidatus Woesearchaeota archaeon]|nr:hypothetical protein [Candidatus Woesearchaeota archaeon]
MYEISIIASALLTGLILLINLSDKLRDELIKNLNQLILPVKYAEISKNVDELKKLEKEKREIIQSGRLDFFLIFSILLSLPISIILDIISPQQCIFISLYREICLDSRAFLIISMVIFGIFILIHFLKLINIKK